MGEVDSESERKRERGRKQNPDQEQSYDVCGLAHIPL